MITRKNIHKVTDGLGLQIDKKIRSIVIRFNALDVVTQASCEGHETHGLPYPWVDFPSPGRWIQELLKEFYGDKPHQLSVESYASWDRLRYSHDDPKRGRKEMERFLTWLEKKMSSHRRRISDRAEQAICLVERLRSVQFQTGPYH